jgi:ribonuclease P protein 1
MQSLHKHIGTVHEPWFPLHLHESSYLDKFPKEQLVYLTPHCREEMLEYDHDAIYIIGAIVDKVSPNGVPTR